VGPVQRRAEDAHRLRLKAQEMLRLAHHATMSDVAQELIEMARLLDERAKNAEAFIPPSQPQRSDRTADPPIDGAVLTRSEVLTVAAHILLVEDDGDVGPLLEHVLIQGGYRVSAAQTATQAHRLMLQDSFDLVLADGRLPDGSGIAVADAAVERGIKVLILSGYIFQFPAADLQRHDYLMKPVRPEELLDRVRAKLRG